MTKEEILDELIENRSYSVGSSSNCWMSADGEINLPYMDPATGEDSILLSVGEWCECHMFDYLKEDLNLLPTDDFNYVVEKVEDFFKMMYHDYLTTQLFYLERSK